MSTTKAFEADFLRDDGANVTVRWEGRISEGDVRGCIGREYAFPQYVRISGVREVPTSYDLAVEDEIARTSSLTQPAIGGRNR